MSYHAKLLGNGVFVPPSQFETCILSSAHSAEDLKYTVDCLLDVVGQLN
jgi:glutamate-1-semialdehyde 2,1-aminomutase